MVTPPSEEHYFSIRELLKSWLGLAQNAIRPWRSVLHSTETQILIALSLLCGVLAGFSAFLFEHLIGWVQGLSYAHWGVTGTLASLSDRWWIVFLPALGGLLCGLLIQKFSKDAKGQGVAEVVYALHREEARIPARTILTRAASAALTLGTGGSAGPEGPVIQIGGGVGSLLGQLCRLPPEVLRTLVAGGAAAGIAAVFNAPMAGVLFAMEVLLHDFAAQAFSMVVLSSVSASVVSRLLMGDRVFLQIPPFAMGSTGEYFLCLILGIVIAPFTQIFISLLNQVEARFDSWTSIPDAMKPMTGGLAVGALGLFVPPILGTGQEFLTQMVRGEIPIWQAGFIVFATLLVVKILATSLTLGSGGSGGLLTPSLFCGAMAGGAFAHAIRPLFHTVNPGSFALVGMVAFFAAMSHAPFTGILMLFELTHDSAVILPALLTCGMASWVARQLHSESYEMGKLRRKGLRLFERRGTDALAQTLVGSVMVKTVETVPMDMTLDTLTQFMKQSSHTGFPVLDPEGRLIGLVSYNEIHQAFNRLGSADSGRVLVQDIMRQRIVTVRPGDTLETVVHLMEESGQDRVPVVDPLDGEKLVGLVSRSNVMTIYHQTLRS